MRLLRKAIDKVDAIMTDVNSRMPDQDLGQFTNQVLQLVFDELRERIMGELEALQEKGRTHLLIHGLEIPLEHPLAVDINLCGRCHTALGDTVEIDYQPGDFEDAGMECCIAHSHPIVQYGRAQQKGEICPKDCDKQGQVCLPDLCDHWNEQRCGGRETTACDAD